MHMKSTWYYVLGNIRCSTYNLSLQDGFLTISAFGGWRTGMDFYGILGKGALFVAPPCLTGQLALLPKLEQIIGSGVALYWLPDTDLTSTSTIQ